MNHSARGSLADLISSLEARARAANSVVELGFSIANDSYELIDFRQVLVFEGADEGARLLTVSGLGRPTEDSPYLIWLRRTWPWLQQRLVSAPGWFQLPVDTEGGDGKASDPASSLPANPSANLAPDLSAKPPADSLPDLPVDLLDGWREWWPPGVYGLPLRRRSGETLGWVLFLLEQAPGEPQARALTQLAASWSYCWEMLAGKPRTSWRARWRRLGPTRRRLLIAAVFLLLLVPVRQTALAPAEVIALDAATVTAPIDGVIKAFHVRPNQSIKAGQLLFSLDDTTLRSRLDVAQKSVAIADAELMSATQKAFDNLQSKGELALLSGRAHEKRAELAAVQAQLARIEVVANEDGLAVFGDPDDWLGRPVATGERIMSLANPANPGILIHLPVADALTLDAGAKVKLFLTVKPLSPMVATVTETSYQATLSAENIASYRLRAQFDHPEDDARIGLRGTAKIYGGWVLLGYDLFRRPLATLREWSGW